MFNRPRCCFSDSSLLVQTTISKKEFGLEPWRCSFFLGIKRSKKLQFLLMAQPQSAEPSAPPLPQTVGDLCLWLGCDIVALYLPCLFCKKPLGLLEKLNFMSSELTLTWQGNSAYACCCCCTSICCRIEFVEQFQNYLPVNEAEEQLGVQFTDLHVRCITCLRPLSPIEKGDIRTNRERVFIVGGVPRAHCMLCRIGL